MPHGTTLSLTLRSRQVIYFNKDVWAKATTDALKSHKDPAIVVVLGETGNKTRLAVIEMSLLEQLIEERDSK